MTEENYLNWAIRLQALAQAGLAYSKDKFDLERFEEIREIAAEMLVAPSGLPLDEVKSLFTDEAGYQTPKIDTRAAIFQDDKILLVQEGGGRWALPGGWCDVDQSVVENTLKEVKEEAGIEAKAVRLIAVLDKAKHNPATSAHRVIKHFVLCKALGGEFRANSETLASSYFSLAELPELSVGKTTQAQIAMCFEASKAEHWETIVD